MASRSDIQAGRAFVSLYIKGGPAVARGLNNVKKSLQGFGKNVMAVGGFLSGIGTDILAPLAGAVAHFVNFGSELSDMSQRTGVAANTLAEFGYAARQSGTDLGTVEKAIRFMQKSGSTETFEKAAERIAAIEDPAKRTAAAIKTFGKTGASLIPMLGNLKALRAEAVRLGLAPTQAAADMAESIGDAFDQVREVIGATFFEIGAALGPALLPGIRMVRDFVVSVNKWVRQNDDLVRTIAMVGAGLLAAGAIVTAAGAAIFGVGSVFGVLAGVVTAIGSAVAFLVTPLGLVTAGLVAGGAAWLYFTDTGRESISYIGRLFASFGKTATDTFKGITDAIAAGDIELAAEVAWAGLKVIWHEGTQEINRLWLGVKWGFLATWQEATTGIAKFFTSAWANIQRGWALTVGFLQSTWNQFSTHLANGWNKAQKGAGNLLIDAAVKTGAVTKEFGDAWREELNRPLDTAIQERTAGAEKREIEIAASEAAELAKINAAEADALKNLEEDKARAYESLNADYRRDLDAKQKALDDARAALAGARGKAAAAAAAAAAVAGPADLPKPGEMADLAKSASLVTFSGSALLAGGRGGQDKLIDEVRKNREASERAAAASERLLNLEKLLVLPT